MNKLSKDELLLAKIQAKQMLLEAAKDLSFVCGNRDITAEVNQQLAMQRVRIEQDLRRLVRTATNSPVLPPR